MTNNKIGIVLQGPTTFCKEVIVSYQHYPFVVWSTWNDEPAENIELIKKSKIDLCLNQKPAVLGYHNCNLQCLSTTNGIIRLKKKFPGLSKFVKIRADIIVDKLDEFIITTIYSLQKDPIAFIGFRYAILEHVFDFIVAGEESELLRFFRPQDTSDAGKPYPEMWLQKRYFKKFFLQSWTGFLQKQTYIDLTGIKVKFLKFDYYLTDYPNLGPYFVVSANKIKINRDLKKKLTLKYQNTILFRIQNKLIHVGDKILKGLKKPIRFIRSQKKREFCIALKFYFYNHWLTKFPNHNVRLFYLKRVLGIKIGVETYIHLGCFFDEGRIEIGNNSVIGRNCFLGGGNLFIKDNVSITAQTYIFCATHLKDSPTFECVRKDVIIEDYAWIGARAMILPGVTIGKGAILGANSTASKSVPPYTVYAGCPAKEVSKRSDCLNYNLRYFPYFQ